ncbi:MAG: AlpA family phage regulatory protein [Erythrobacteraceae bacterium]|nr:AlpA family phage regulatory protein [Erythrobacteraceae bacterium]
MSQTSRNIANLPPEALLRLPEVIALVGLCRASIYARAAQHSFPRPIKLTAHASGWRLGDVRAWLADPTGWKPSNNTDEMPEVLS